MIRLPRLLPSRRVALLLLPYSEMVYDFCTRAISKELTLDETYAYIWSRTPDVARFLCWDLSSETEHKQLLEWMESLDEGQRLDAFRACLLVFSASNGQVIPRQFQLSAGLAAYSGKDTIVNAGTGSGKTLSMVIPLLMNPQAVAIVISPLKRLQSTQAQEMKRFSIRPLVINRDVELSPTEIQVSRAKSHLYLSPRVYRCHRC